MTTPTGTRVRGLYLFQLGVTTTKAAAQTWLNTFLTKMGQQDSQATLRTAIIGNKGGVVIEIWSPVPATTISKTRTAIGVSAPVATEL